MEQKITNAPIDKELNDMIMYQFLIMVWRLIHRKANYESFYEDGTGY